MATFNIPLTTLPVGSRDFGPVTVADNDTEVTLSVDRTVSGGLNATPSASLVVQVSQSGDSGATWKVIAAATFPGGTVNFRGSVLTASQLITTWDPGTGRQGKATIAVSGATVTVAGTIITQ